MNLLELFMKGALRDPGKTAVVDEGARLTFRNLVRASKGLGSFLGRATRKDAVGVFLPTCKEFVISYMAALMAGKTALPLNILMSAEDIDFVAKDAGLDTIVTSRKFLKIMKREEAISGAVTNVVCLEDVAGSRWKKLTLLARGALFRPRIVGEDEIVTLLYTSGTTGRPKGVRLTHRNMASNIQACIDAVKYTPDDVAVQMLPLFHTFALTVTMGVPLATGATSVAMKRFAPDPILDAVERHGCTFLVAIPSMFRVLVRSQRQKPRDVGSLRCAISGGEPLPDELREGFEEVFGIELLNGYGLTETSPVVSFNLPEANRPGSVGTPLPGVEVRIADEEGNVLAAGDVGELQVKGPNVMAGYHERPEETAASFAPGGWLRTGDMARLDREGYLWITGRKKEMMIVGGENVFPAEVEDALLRHPAVAEVGVIGVPDKRRGECPKAFVVLAEGEEASPEDILRFARERLPVHKVPRDVEFRDELPKAPTGKVMRRLLKEGGGDP
ncbi:MAG: class I adenylate-forming enzyme family protein [Planctomycetota bacterium]|jgi:long-chain acyl-CoA synthetase